MPTQPAPAERAAKNTHTTNTETQTTPPSTDGRPFVPTQADAAAAAAAPRFLRFLLSADGARVAAS
jgi:hypothetical protein